MNTMPLTVVQTLPVQTVREKRPTEVYAAREKNGVYIPKELFLHDEAEKKAMSEKIESLEFEVEFKDKQSTGLQDLYNSQKLLNTELSDKLEKNQRKLENTEHALSELEEKYRQANITIKEKEYLISNLLRSEKALIESAHELRTELENAVADLSGLFSKIERKNKIEDDNNALVKRFRVQLSEQLELLHRVVSTSASQQANQLTEMEEEMQSFLTTKATATETIHGRVALLKDAHISSVRALDDLAGELNENSQSTFERLNTQVVKHTSIVEECFKGMERQADQLLDELQSSLSKQQNEVAAFANQQLEQHLRTVDTTRSISKITTNFFDTLDVHASKVSKIVEESENVQDQQLTELQKKFEESAAKEERQLLQNVAELLASANARHQKLIQTAVSCLRQSAANRTSGVQTEISTAHNFTSSVREQWKVYIEESENHYVEDIAKVETERHSLEDGLQQCMLKTEMSSQQWKTAQESLLHLGEDNVTSIDSIFRSGMKANEHLHARLSSAASNSLKNYEVANKDLLTSIECSSKLDHDAQGKIGSIIVPCRGELREMKSGHHHKLLEITGNAQKFLEEEYVVDEPSCSTPQRRSIVLPNVTSIEELKTPAFEELLKSFQDSKSAASKQSNGEAKQFSTSHETQTLALRDSRVPLVAIN